MTDYLNEAFLNTANQSLLGLTKLRWFANEAQKVLEKNIDGDIAECGVYRGGSARVLATIFQNKKVYLFDSFEGMLENDSLISGHHKRGEFGDTSLDYAMSYLSDKENCIFVKGWIPESTTFLTNETFSLIHLDLDLYQSTKSALDVFWPRLNTGGCIIFDDVNWVPCPGVDKCLSEYFIDIPHKRTDGPNMCSIEKIIYET